MIKLMVGVTVILIALKYLFYKNCNLKKLNKINFRYKINKVSQKLGKL